MGGNADELAKLVDLLLKEAGDVFLWEKRRQLAVGVIATVNLTEYYYS